MNRSPLRTMNMVPLGGYFVLQHYLDDNLGSSGNISLTATSKASPFGKHTNRFHLPHGYGCPPSQQPFLGTHQLYDNSPLNMPHSSQPTSSASQGFASCGPQWQGYDLHQGGYDGSKVFPLPSFQDNFRDLQAHRECHQHHKETIWAFSKRLPALLLHLDHLTANQDVVSVHLGGHT